MWTTARIGLLLAAASALVALSCSGGETDGDADGDTDVDSDVDGDTDSDADTDGDGDADSDGDTDADGDSDTDGDGDADSDGDSDGDGDTDVDSDVDADGDGDGDADGDVDADVDADADADGDPGTCVDVSGDYGICDMAIGIGWDGDRCVSFSGCDCAPHCGDFFTTMEACASACADAGHCNDSLMHGAGIGPDPFGVGHFCDEITACTSMGGEYGVRSVVPSADCAHPLSFCGATSTACNLMRHVTVSATDWDTLCEVSLISGVDQILCVVWGP